MSDRSVWLRERINARVLSGFGNNGRIETGGSVKRVHQGVCMGSHPASRPLKKVGGWGD